MPTKDAVEVAIGSPRCPALHDAGSRGPRQLFGLWRILRARRPMLPCGLARPRVSRSVAPGPRFPRIIPSLLSRYKGEGNLIVFVMTSNPVMDRRAVMDRREFVSTVVV